MIDGVTGFGRAIMRGVMRYANVQRRWLLHEELRHPVDVPLPNWPECDGAILAGVGPAVLEFVRERSGHVVRCSGSADPRVTPAAAVDDHAVGRLAAEHLLDCQLEHFGFFGRTDTPVSQGRFEGFCQALSGRGFSCSDAALGWPTNVEWLDPTHLPKLIDWLRALPKPVGVMAVDDSAAHDLAAACLQAGIGVPDHVAIIGVNNDDLLCDSAWPPLSSVDCDYSRCGYVAAGMLDRLLKGERLAAAERMVRAARRSASCAARAPTCWRWMSPRSPRPSAFIREHACDPCSVGDVLRHVPVGRRWLERQFVKKLGRNPHDEIMRMRIETAKRLLLQPGLTLPDVAERCGFAANQNLGRAFLKVTGMTPGAYRRAAVRGAR